MRAVQRQPISLLDSWPTPDTDAVHHALREELRRFDPELAERRQIEVVNKIDLVDEERLEELRARARADGREVFFISARDGIGIEDLVAALWKLRDEVQVHEPLHHFVEAENVDEEEFEDIEVIYTRE